MVVDDVVEGAIEAEVELLDRRRGIIGGHGGGGRRFTSPQILIRLSSGEARGVPVTWDREIPLEPDPVDAGVGKLPTKGVPLRAPSLRFHQPHLITELVNTGAYTWKS